MFLLPIQGEKTGRGYITDNKRFQDMKSLGLAWNVNDECRCVKCINNAEINYIKISKKLF